MACGFILRLLFLLLGSHDLDPAAHAATREGPASIDQSLVVREPLMRFGELLRGCTRRDDIRDGDVVELTKHCNYVLAGQSAHVCASELAVYPGGCRKAFTGNLAPW